MIVFLVQSSTSKKVVKIQFSGNMRSSVRPDFRIRTWVVATRTRSTYNIRSRLCWLNCQ